MRPRSGSMACQPIRGIRSIGIPKACTDESRLFGNGWLPQMTCAMGRKLGRFSSDGVLLRQGVVGECLLDRRFHQLGGAAQAQATQLLDHSDGLLACCREVLAGVDRL